MLLRAHFVSSFVRSRSARNALKDRLLDASADKTYILCPEEERAERAAIFLPGQLEKIKAVHPESTLETQMKRVRGGKTQHGATKAYQFNRCAVVGGSVVRGSFRHRLVGPSVHNVFAPSKRVDSAALVNSALGMKYFGHWLLDDILTYELARQQANPLSLTPPVWTPTLDFYSSKFDQAWGNSNVVSAKELIIYSDHAQNSSKRDRQEIVRKRYAASSAPVDEFKRVFLRRGATGNVRVFANEDSVAEALAEKGFVVADVESEDIDTILGKLNGARLVVSVEGSHISHCRYTIHEEGALVVMQPPNRFDNVHKDWVDSVGCRYAFVLCDEGANGFHMDLDDLARTIDLVS